MISKLNHLGIVVESLEDSMTHYDSLFGRAPRVIEELPDRGVRVAIYDMGESTVELIEPLGPRARIVFSDGN